MDTIDYEDLRFVDRDSYSSGSYGTIKRCILDGKTYAIKEFKEASYLIGKKKMLEQISKIKEDGLYTPKFWVKKDNKTNCYLTYFCDGKDIDLFYEYSIKDKVRLLKDAKNKILLMHDLGIIHADLIGSNIMISDMNACIIDFDNASYKFHKTKKYEVNDLSRHFLEKYGITKDVDIFIFNILTFSLINNCGFYLSRKKILKNNFGYFNNSDAKKICESLFLENNIPNQDFLIDTIDETSFSI